MDQSGNYKLEYYSAIHSRDVEWLWYPYIPYGKITIVQGDPGEGKTTFMIQLTALLTTGRKMPDGSGGGEKQNVIYQAAEDSLSDTIRPRLEIAGADCNRVAFLDLEDEIMSLDDTRFERAIIDTRASLLVIDPLQAFLNESDSIKSGGIRSILTRISRVAERTGCAVVLVGHLNKKSGSKGIYRGLGSIDIAASARSILLIGRDADNPEIRVMAQLKNSLAPEGKGYVFGLDPDRGFQWLGESDYLLEEILNTTSKVEDGKKDRAKKHLQEALQEKDLLSVDVYNMMAEIGISKRTCKLARNEMDITVYRKDGSWYWHLEVED